MGAESARPRLLVLHGHSMNAAVMRAHLGPLAERLERTVELVFPEAPHTCPDDSVDRLYAVWSAPRLPPPHLSWWDATDDGRQYRGWEQTLERVREHLHGDLAGVLGFSQGGILAAAIAALASHGELPAPRCVVVVAGRRPRSDVLAPYLQRPVPVPSLHVWGDADGMAASGPAALVEDFGPEGREVLRWPGDHRVPTQGAPADAIVRFVERHATRP